MKFRPSLDEPLQAVFSSVVSLRFTAKFGLTYFSWQARFKRENNTRMNLQARTT